MHDYCLVSMPGFTYVSFLFSKMKVSLLHLCLVPKNIPSFTELKRPAKVLGRLLHSLQAQNLDVPLHFLSWPLWLLQTVVTSSNLLAARYVDRYEGGSLCWSQLP